MGFVPVDNCQELPHMNIPRVGHASFALSGRIYAVGGMDGKVPKTWRKHPCDDVFFFFLGWFMSMMKCLNIQEVLKNCVVFFGCR